MKFHRNDIIKFIVLDFLFSFKIRISPSLRNFFSILALCVCVWCVHASRVNILLLMGMIFFLSFFICYKRKSELKFTQFEFDFFSTTFRFPLFMKWSLLCLLLLFSFQWRNWLTSQTWFHIPWVYVSICQHSRVKCVLV